MTILTTNVLLDKKIDKDLLLDGNSEHSPEPDEPTHVYLTTTGTILRDHPAPSRPRRTRATQPRQGIFFYIIYTLLGLALLAAGVFLAIFIFQQVYNEPHEGRRVFKCAVKLRRSGPSARQQQVPSYILEQVTFDKHAEQVDIPKWNKDGGASVLQLFNERITAVYDHQRKICFIKKMNSHLRPPTSVRQLYKMLENGKFIPKANLVRLFYKARTPSLTREQIQQRYGNRLTEMCGGARFTFELVPRASLNPMPWFEKLPNWPRPRLPYCPLKKCLACPPGFENGRSSNGCPGCHCVKKSPEYCPLPKCYCKDERYTLPVNARGCRECKCTGEDNSRSRRSAEVDTMPMSISIPDTAVDAERTQFYELVVNMKDVYEVIKEKQ